MALVTTTARCGADTSAGRAQTRSEGRRTRRRESTRTGRGCGAAIARRGLGPRARVGLTAADLRQHAAPAQQALLQLRLVRLRRARVHEPRLAARAVHERRERQRKVGAVAARAQQVGDARRRPERERLVAPPRHVLRRI
eukprot:1380004-Prymnesium_polylepis.1